MQPIDYSTLLSATAVEHGMPPGAAAENIYQSSDGVRFASRENNSKFTADMVRLADDAFLLASESAALGRELQHQIVNDSDWVHIQFRLSGGGRE